MCSGGTPSPSRSSDCDSMEVSVGSDASSEPCNHLLATEEEIEVLKAKVKSFKYFGPECMYCMREGQVNPDKQRRFMLCTVCDQCSCVEMSREDQTKGHTSLHALMHGHWVALWVDKPTTLPQKKGKPTTGYCFLCDHDVDIHGESDGTWTSSDESTSSEVKHAAKGDHAHASGPKTDAGGAGYVIRGIPNIGNTCYMNALVQCLLVPDKLRTGLLGPNAPKGTIGTALKELFVDTRAGNDAGVRLLNPWNLWKSISALDPKYDGGSMHDTHELLCSLRKWLNEEELRMSPNTQDCTSGAVSTTVVDSVFQGELSTTRTNNCCQYETVQHAPFHELSLPLPSKKHPRKSIASPQRTHISQQKSPVVKQLFPAVEESNSENVQMIADAGDSALLYIEVESVAMEKSSEPLEVEHVAVDYSESTQMHEMIKALHGPLLSHKDAALFPELPEEIIEMPVKSVPFLPDSVLSVELEEMHEPTTDSSSDVEQTEDADGAYQSNKSEADKEGKENMCTKEIIREHFSKTIIREHHIDGKEKTCMVQGTKEDKGKALSCNFSYDEKAEGSIFRASIKDCLELFLKEEVIERRCEKCAKVLQQPSTTRSTHGNTSVDSIIIEQQYDREHANQKVTISKLPPVLTVQLMRFGKDKDDNSKQVKIEGHVSFEESLDVRQFMEPSSEDKDNSSYRLVGIIEHIGDSLNSGHFVAYVRVSRDGSKKQLSSGSSSWFRADDGDIQQVSLEEVLKREAFILFYERMEGLVSNQSE